MPSVHRPLLFALLALVPAAVPAAGPAAVADPPLATIEVLPDRPLETSERRASGRWLRLAGGAGLLREASSVSGLLDGGYLVDLDGRFTLGAEGRLAMGTGWTWMGAGPGLQVRAGSFGRLTPWLGAEALLGMISVDSSKSGVTTQRLPAGLRAQAATSGGLGEPGGGGERTGPGGPAPFRFCAVPGLAGGFLVRLAGDMSLDVALRYELRLYRGGAHDSAGVTVGVRSAL